MKIKSEFKDGNYNYKEIYRLMKLIEKRGWRVHFYASLGGLKFDLEKEEIE